MDPCHRGNGIDHLDAFDQRILPFSFPAFTNQLVAQSVTRLMMTVFNRPCCRCVDPKQALFRIESIGGWNPKETTSSPLLTHEFPNQRPADYAVQLAVDSLNESRYPFRDVCGWNNAVPQVDGVHYRAEDGRELLRRGVDGDGDELRSRLIRR